MFFSVSFLATCVALLSSAKADYNTIPAAAFPNACAKFGATWSFPNVTINFATFVPGGTNLTFQQDVNLKTCNRPFQVVPQDMCRIAMYVSTTNRSGLTFEAWFPANWTGRFMVTGNGGQSGCIQYEDLAYGMSLGIAAVGSNNGHNGTSGLTFYNNFDVVVDFAWRALKASTIVGKQITQDFYGRAYKKAYYLGCSTGGRQGMYAAQYFPSDFDGILAGSPAIDRNQLVSWAGHFYAITGNSTSKSFLSSSQWALVHAEVLRQCDGIDGVIDGIIEDPTLCYPRPEALQCSPGNTTSCLTNDQVLTVRGVLSDYIGEDRSLIFPRLQPGAELTAALDALAGAPSPYIGDWFKYVIYSNPSWDPASFNIKDATYSINLNPANIETWSGDLSAFRKAGGKMISYHGQQDSTVTSPNSARYYNHVSNVMGLKSTEIDDFFRLFRIGGMQHCSGGPGAWKIGQTLAGSTGNPADSQHNIFLRLIDWVENGALSAPESVTGFKYVNDTVSLGVDFVRNHCKYPLRNLCVNSTAYKDPKSWTCI